MSEEEKDLIRYVEQEILDQEYKKYGLLLRDPNLALGSLLRKVGDLWRDKKFYTGREEVDGYIKIGSVVASLDYCVQWICNQPPKQTEMPETIEPELDKEILEFLKWGWHYNLLFANHVAWGREELQARVNMTDKVIEFYNHPDFDNNFYLSQKYDFAHELEDSRKDYPSQELERDFSRLREKSKDMEWVTDIDPELIRQFGSYPLVIRWLEKSFLPDVDGNTPLGDYTLNDLLNFYASLLIYCNYITWLEDSTFVYENDPFGPEYILDTLILVLPQPEMVEYLRELSGLSAETTWSIISDHLLEPSKKSASLRTHPFIKSPDNHIFLLPRLISHADVGRMLTAAMNKDSRRKIIYANLVQKLSDNALSQIASLFQAKGFEVRQQAKIKDSRGTTLRPDLIIWDKTMSELLVADYKHMLSPITSSEKSYKVKDIEKGLKQVHRYLSALADSNNWPTEFSPAKTPKITGMLLFKSAMVAPTRTDMQVALANAFALRKQLSQPGFTSVAELINWARTRLELPLPEGEWEERQMEVKVSDWTYRRTVFGAR